MKLLVITGGSRGIGLATIKKFLHNSFTVANISRTPCPLSEVTQVAMNLKNFTPQNLQPIGPLMEQAQQITLIHNASRLDKDSTQDVEGQALEEVFAINVLAPAKLNQWAIPKMKMKARAENSILYVGSTLSEQAVPNAFSYVTSKHAQAGMMRATCQDLMGQGIHTALICPGFTDTQMLRQHVGDAPSTLQAMADTNSYGRLIHPEEIADTLYFAATHPVVNGSTLHVNLGFKET